MKDYPVAAPAATSLRAQPPSTSLRSAKPSWHRARSGAAAPDNRQRILLFMAGGMTFSEVREAYQLSTALGKDIYIGIFIPVYFRDFANPTSGSTHTFTPRQFVDDLKVVDLGGVGSKALPNGLQPSRGGKRPFQEFYDEKYFTRDAPPPQKPAPSLPPPQDRSKLTRPSPAPSFAGSSHSVAGSATEGKEKEKKKKRFFGL